MNKIIYRVIILYYLFKRHTNKLFYKINIINCDIKRPVYISRAQLSQNEFDIIIINYRFKFLFILLIILSASVVRAFHSSFHFSRCHTIIKNGLLSSFIMNSYSRTFLLGQEVFKYYRYFLFFSQELSS